MLVDFVRSMVNRKRTYEVSPESGTIFEGATASQPPLKRPCESSVTRGQLSAPAPPKRSICVRCANGESGHITHIMG
ncbi:hypothetical protein QR680_005479 [Steinernema hermaphroditum]|uniref:Uncharacterized protein n=1 Tax=Steinernema hermaphroditum TaxID=289476 RepID=A0AA39HS65_9BILA|nr:hypothetical protein QR680_005479 [Steinernema hermaphroditum]